MKKLSAAQCATHCYSLLRHITFSFTFQCKIIFPLSSQQERIGLRMVRLSVFRLQTLRNIRFSWTTLYLASSKIYRLKAKETLPHSIMNLNESTNRPTERCCFSGTEKSLITNQNINAGWCFPSQLIQWCIRCCGGKTDTLESLVVCENYFHAFRMFGRFFFVTNWIFQKTEIRKQPKRNFLWSFDRGTNVHLWMWQC